MNDLIKLLGLAFIGIGGFFVFCMLWDGIPLW